MFYETNNTETKTNIPPLPVPPKCREIKENGKEIKKMKRKVKPIFNVYNELKRPVKNFIDFHLGVKLQSVGYGEWFRSYCLFICLGFWWMVLGFELIPKEAEE